MNTILGSIVRIGFLDHVEDADEPILCEVFGRIVKQTKDHIVICCWDLPDSKQTVRKNNWKIFSILRGAIRELSVYVRLDEHDKPIEN